MPLVVSIFFFFVIFIPDLFPQLQLPELLPGRPETGGFRLAIKIQEMFCMENISLCFMFCIQNEYYVPFMPESGVYRAKKA